MEMFPELSDLNLIFQTKRRELEEILNQETREWKDLNRVFICDLTYDILVLAEFIEQTVYDLELGKSSDFIFFGKAYSEISSKGLNAARDKNGVFFDSKALEILLGY